MSTASAIPHRTGDPAGEQAGAPGLYAGARPFGFSAPWALFWTALLVRVAYMTLAHTYRFNALEDHFHFGWEMGRIARSLAEGGGYADPFAGHTGPTAWVPPLFPFLLAAVFRIFGVYSAASAWAILALNSLFSAITALAIYEIALRCFGRKNALWSGWLWALYPAAMQFAVRWVWETALTAMLFSWALAAALRMRRIGEGAGRAAGPQSTSAWLTLGLCWALIALANPSLLLFLPACGLWILAGAAHKPRAAGQAALAALLFLACLAPWTWRNWKVLHAFVPLRSNLGAEMWAWNKPGSNGITLGATMEPVPQDRRLMLYARLGEIAYCRDRGEEAKAYIYAHPWRFARLSLKRVYFFWVSVPHPVDNRPLIEGGRELSYFFLSLSGLLGLLLALKNRAPAAWLFAWAFLLLPLTYYLVNVQARFRHPLEPLIDILSVYLFQSARPRRAAARPRE